ncbi:plasmid mobilization protein [Shinella pollutisoli]|uniref:Uncharacterized protein n=1 Tax=Shinella pollutisoli TaxID=2250594 RepID=A0ABV7D9T1_9HYPH
MASGSESRQRPIMLAARFNEQEAEAIRQMADRAGIPVASLIRSATLSLPPPHAVRRPTASHTLTARLLGEVGRLAETLHAAGAAGTLDLDNPHVAAALRDIAEIRTACFLALGRQP